jgi:recombination protein RecA
MSMPSAAALRAQIEAVLAKKIPSALTPQPHILRPVMPTNVREIDELAGGLPAGAISEIVGPESSGRTSLALAFVAGITQAGKVCAWVDVSDALHPESAAAAGVDLSRMLWVRCGVTSQRGQRQSAQPEIVFPVKYTLPPAPIKGLHGGGFGPHPRTEAKGLSTAVGDLLEVRPPVCAESVRKPRPQKEDYEQPAVRVPGRRKAPAGKPWPRLDQALRATDLLLQAGGFASIVLDMGSIEPEHALRVPLATWFRFRAAAERTQMNFLLLTQDACAKNSAGLVLHLGESRVLATAATVFTGIEHRAELDYRRFAPSTENVLPLRKPAQSVRTTAWRSKASWTARA